ncbi:uncharacterized protein LOC142984072 [Anticarsia gemmatalis]|uniref:uncharacterized protein LOC142984072 n=1 Tax=Anticarsia gemmatalis TaxID=129554 RepID=UPI003F764DED
MYTKLKLCILFFVFTTGECAHFDVTSEEGHVPFAVNPAPDSHRCGVCPTYFQKICAYDVFTKRTFIFDNHCIMDLYNCLEGTQFSPMEYDKCLYFGNFAYVHGYKYEDMDYGENHIVVKNSKKNPDFIDISK